MSTDEDIILAEAAFILVSEDEPQKKRGFWVRPSLDRNKYNGNRMLADYIQDDLIGFGPGEGIRSTFQNFLRMTCTDFEDILKMIGPKIKRQNTNFRVPISINERLVVTLRFLASGDSFMDLSYFLKCHNHPMCWSQYVLLIFDHCIYYFSIVSYNVDLNKNIVMTNVSIL